MRCVLPVLLMPVVACGTLVGSDGLRRIDSLDIPRNLAWEMRWLQDGELIGQCPLQPLSEGEVDLTFLPFGQLDLIAPQPASPVVWRSFDTAAVSIGIPVAVTRGSQDVRVRAATEESPLQNVFALTSVVYVHVAGPAASVDAELDLRLVQGGQWLELNDVSALQDDDVAFGLIDETPPTLPWLAARILQESDPSLRDWLQTSRLPTCAEE